MKNKIFTLVLLAAIFFSCKNVYASDGLCTSTAYSRLKSEAYNITFNYELKRTETG